MGVCKHWTGMEYWNGILTLFVITLIVMYVSIMPQFFNVAQFESCMQIRCLATTRKLHVQERITRVNQPGPSTIPSQQVTPSQYRPSTWIPTPQTYNYMYFPFQDPHSSLIQPSNFSLER